MVTRAIHLEVVEGMSATQFLMALRRFVARRGAPDSITCDNAKQFVLCKTVVNAAFEQAVTCHDVKCYAASNAIK